MAEELRIYSRQELEALGKSERAIRRAVQEERLVRVRAGQYANGDAWRALYVEGRQRVWARAAAAAAAVPPIFCGVTAAAIHDLPLFRVQDRRFHVLARADRASAKSASVARHEVPFTDDDLVERNGLIVTSLDRTIFDVIRHLPHEAGVALVDAALRGAVDQDELRARVADRIARAGSARGIRKARTVLAFADGRAESTGESGSRWYLHVLGFTGIELQVVFRGPEGEDWRVDIKFKRGWGEFDGATKYTDPEFLKGRTPQQAVIDEKRREDWIRGRSQEPFARWMDKDMPNAAALGRHLAAFGITPDR